MIKLKTADEIVILREGGKLLATVLKAVAKSVKPGISVFELNRISEKMILAAGAKPSFKGYKSRFTDTPFPATLCASINNEVVHGPGTRERLINEGDIVGLDLGLIWKGLFTDHAVTVPVGKVSPEAAKLIAVTEKAMYLGIEAVKPGNYIKDISTAVQKYVEKNGFSVVRDLVGHGVGYQVHEDPKVPNYVPRGGQGEMVKIKENMVLAIEPMVNAGGWQVDTMDDGWTVVTADGSWSAHFEHTVVVTKDGCDILTKI